jgi:hypothetical protein
VKSRPGRIRLIAWWLADRGICRARIQERYRRELIADPSPTPIAGDVPAAAPGGLLQVAKVRRAPQR